MAAAPDASATSARSATNRRRSSPPARAARSWRTTTRWHGAHSIIDCGRAKDTEEKEFTFGANYRLSELNAALLVVAMRRFPGQQEERATNGLRFERLAADIPGVRVMPRDEAHHAMELLQLHPGDRPGAFGGATNETVCAALEAEGIPAEVQYPPMSRYELFRPSLSRLPWPWSTPSASTRRMSFPVAEAAGSANPSTHGGGVPRRGARGAGRGRRPREGAPRGGAAGTDRAARQAGKNLGRWRSFAASSASSRGRARS